MRERGFLGFGLMGYVAVIGGSALLLSWGAVYVQTSRLNAAEDEISAFRATSKAQEEANRKKAEGDAKLKEAKDREAKRRFADLDARYKRLLDSPTVSVLPPAEPSGGADLACFSRPELERALNQFIGSVAGLVVEGDKASIGLDLAREWTQELMRR